MVVFDRSLEGMKQLELRRQRGGLPLHRPQHRAGCGARWNMHDCCQDLRGRHLPLLRQAGHHHHPRHRGGQHLPAGHQVHQDHEHDLSGQGRQRRSTPLWAATASAWAVWRRLSARLITTITAPSGPSLWRRGRCDLCAVRADNAEVTACRRPAV